MSLDGYVFFDTLNFLPLPIAQIAVYLFVSSFVQNLIILTLSFLYRYYAVCHPEGLETFQRNYIRNGIVSLLIICLIMAGVYLAMNPTPYCQAVMDRHFSVVSRYSLGKTGHICAVVIVNGQLNWRLLLGLGNFAVFITVSGLVIVSLALRIGRNLKGSTAESETVARNQKKIFTLLIFQLSLPLLFNIVPIQIVILSTYFQLPTDWLVHSLGAILSFAQVVDPILIFYFIKPYRQAFQKNILRQNVLVNSTSATRTMLSTTLNEDKKVLFGCLLGSVIVYNGVKYLWNFFKRGNNSDFVPIGTIKDLYIFLAKSCKGKKVFSYYCGKRGPKFGEMEDRHLQIYDGNTGIFCTMRQKPKMVLIEVEVKDDILSVSLPDGRKATVKFSEILERRDVRPTYLFRNSRQDGLDCGDDIAKLLSDFLEEPNFRMALYVSGLHNERFCVTQPTWWVNTPVPKRTDEMAYEDNSPYMIMTQGSMDVLNSKLDQEISFLQFRPVILVDRCAAFDEDKWDALKIGDVEIQCYKPCDRCVVTTVNPETGAKDPENEPLRTLRQFRLAPEGPLRTQFKESPLFGVCGGIIQEGYIHEGQVVYAKYKKAPF